MKPLLSFTDATVNLEDNKLTQEERDNRKYFRTLEPTIYVPPDGILPIICYDGRLKFKMKKPDWDAKGAIDGFFVEEDIRRQFFYPYLPCNFIDVGAAHGSWTLPALAAGSSVVGFEIDPRYHKTLGESVIINDNFHKRLRIYKLGLYDSYGEGSFEELDGVTFAKLDDVMKFMVFRPEYIKIDVEGLEWHVLNGARKTIDLLRPKLFIEVHYLKDSTASQKKDSDNNIIDFLKEYDYKVEKGRGEKAFSYFLFT